MKGPELFETKHVYNGPGLAGGAEFSSCGKYRYKLWRIWNDELPKAMCIGLKPAQEEGEPTWVAVIKDRALHLESVYHKYEAKELKLKIHDANICFPLQTKKRTWP